MREINTELRKEIMGMKKGETFRNVDMQFRFKTDCATVGRNLKGLAADGIVRMVRRGTWERIKAKEAA